MWPSPRDPSAEAVEAYLESALGDVQRIRSIAESFAAQSQAVGLLAGAASRTVRGELLGLAEPFALPPRAERDVGAGAERVALMFSGGSTRLAVVVQARRAASLEDVEKAGRLVADGRAERAWLVALAGAPAEVRERARFQGVLFTGPSEFELLAAEAGAPVARPAPKGVALVTCEPWKSAAAARVVEDAEASGKADAGRVLKALAADVRFKVHMKDAAKVVADAVKEANAMKPQERKARRAALLSLDEYEVLRENAPFLAAELGCPVEVLTSGNPESRTDRLRGKAEAALPLRPAIAIEY
jgi:hypothetical protein